MDRLDQGGADAQNGHLLRVAQPKVAMVEQEVRAVLAAVALLRQRVGIVGAADHLEVCDVQLEAAGRARLRTSAPLMATADSSVM